MNELEPQPADLRTVRAILRDLAPECADCTRSLRVRYELDEDVRKGLRSLDEAKDLFLKFRSGCTGLYEQTVTFVEELSSKAFNLTQNVCPKNVPKPNDEVMPQTDHN